MQVPAVPPRGPVLPRAFYARDAETVAQALLGKVLVMRSGRRLRRARITETEAYVGEHDLASHSSKGRTPRTETMFGPPGRAYVYLIYGMHHCLNVVTGRRGEGQAVLLRAAEPLDGWDVDLRGPGRLARALGLTRSHDKADLVRGALRIEDAPAVPAASIEASPRIGIDYAAAWAHAPLRFTLKGSSHLSKRPGGRKRKARQPLPSATRMTQALADQRCIPCSGETPKMRREEAEKLLRDLDGWTLEGDRLAREWTLKDFAEALEFTNAIGRLAEQEQHHPDLHLTGYKHLRVELSTHAIGGLSQNDFVLAAKIDRLPQAKAKGGPRPPRPSLR